MASEKSKILVFGGTGYIGKYMVKASISLGHQTLVHSRPINHKTSPSKIKLCQEFISMGATLIHIVTAIKKVDIVISTLAYPQVLDQLKIIDAIKTAGNIKVVATRVSSDKPAPAPAQAQNEEVMFYNSEDPCQLPVPEIPEDDFRNRRG
ncbi:hypothetical protein L6164_020996 [Bauhinia variegata]|uniref:Uncharacterized protein n=1 Tax=Bauhinia variegata TaxID=167791 RepID=A0ACB9MWY3_BAUVA|nr:hypothetical protein L6164_020996 [Bauhinia variegata]